MSIVERLERATATPFAWTIVDTRTGSFMNGYICKSRGPADVKAAKASGRYRQYVAVPLFLASDSPFLAALASQEPQP